MSNFIVLVKQVPDVSQITDNAFDPDTGTLHIEGDELLQDLIDTRKLLVPDDAKFESFELSDDGETVLVVIASRDFPESETLTISTLDLDSALPLDLR